MNQREFIYAVIPGLEQDLNEARQALFEAWKKEKNLTVIPDKVLWELFNLGFADAKD